MIPYFDLHCDTISECALKGVSLRDNRSLHVSLERGKALGPWFQCFAVWIPDESDSPLQRFRLAADCLKKEARNHSDLFTLCQSQEDLKKIAKDCGIGAILTVEGGSVLEGRLEVLEELSASGVKMITLTWNRANEIGGGAMEPGGLTPFGQQVLKEMERLKILPDVSHASDPLFWETAEAVQGPLVASHSNSRKVCPHPRNLTDDQFREICRRGGLVGLNFYREFLTPSGQCGMEAILSHAEHFLSLGGEDILAMGSDFDGAEMPQGIEGIQSIESLAECFLRHGYAESLVKKIFYQNSFSFFQKHMANQVKSPGTFDNREKL